MMESTRSFVYNCIGLYLIIFTGLHIFCKGFLLTRKAFLDRTEQSKTSLDAPYERAVIIIIDAWHYDFIAKFPDHEAQKSYFKNKMPFMQNLSTSENAVLFKFIADAPTTTMQRIKGLTTGSLPTFIDMSNNFQGSEIEEDNVIDQIISGDKSIVFMGDDTWDGLFPKQFQRKYSFPSFVVKDLDTVDNGVIKNVFPELLEKDWTLLIGHFLGVDHCGHTFGKDHPRMEQKLKQMDQVLQQIIDQMMNDTILLIMGDHGMTTMGEHGGDSDVEVTAALLAYSKRPFQNKLPDFHTVHQTDLVPSLASLIGTSIPFSNIGGLIPSLFANKTQLFEAYERNIKQCLTFLRRYSDVTSDISSRQLQHFEELATFLKNKFDATKLHIEKDDESFQALLKSHVNFFESLRTMFVELWAKFDTFNMATGSVILSIGILFGTVIACPSLTLILIFSNVLLFVNAIPGVIETATLLVIFGFLVKHSHVLVAKISTVVSCQRKSVLGLFVLLVILSNVLKFSNSFVVFEDLVVLYLSQTVFLVFFISCFNLLNTAKRSTSSWLILLLMLIPLCCIRLAHYWRGCREENHFCEPFHFSMQLQSIMNSTNLYTNIRFVLTSFSVAFFPVVCSFYCAENLLSHSESSLTLRLLFLRHSIPTVALCTALHWILESLPSQTRTFLPPWLFILFPRIVFAGVASLVISIVSSPVLVHLVNRRRTLVPTRASRIADIGRALRDEFRTNKQISIVGLSRCLTSPLLLIFSALLCLLMLLLSDGVSLSLLLAPICLLSVTKFFSTFLVDGLFNCLHVSVDEIIVESLPPLVHLVTFHWFFNTNHQLTITSIDWNCAFIGFNQMHISHAIPAVMIILNTFCSFVLAWSLVPMLVVLLKVGRKSLNEDDSQTPQDSSPEIFQSECDLTVGSLSTLDLVVNVYSRLVRLLALDVLSAQLSAGLLRRHLMVWKIFAPAFLFKGIMLLVSCPVALASILIFRRIFLKVRQSILRASIFSAPYPSS